MKFNGFEFFGGATITRVLDGAGAEWIGCTARRNADQRFGFYLFKNGVEVPYTPFCTGRGSVNDQGWWIASDNKDYFTGAIPGFAPLPALLSLQRQLAALQQQLAGSPPVITGGTLTIGPQGPPLEGGELRLSDGAGGWITIDGRAGNLRVVLTGAQTLRVFAGGALAEEWPKV